MSIWKSEITKEVITTIRTNTMVPHLGIEFTEIGEDFLSGRMPVDHRTMQPYGIMHGGASCVLAETLGSVAGCHCVDIEKQICVGLTINTNHIRMAREGYVYGSAKPVHLGRKTQIWEIDIVNEEGDLVSTNRLTLVVLDRD